MPDGGYQGVIRGKGAASSKKNGLAFAGENTRPGPRAMSQILRDISFEGWGKGGENEAVVKGRQDVTSTTLKHERFTPSLIKRGAKRKSSPVVRGIRESTKKNQPRFWTFSDGGRSISRA